MMKTTVRDVCLQRPAFVQVLETACWQPFDNITMRTNFQAKSAYFAFTLSVNKVLDSMPEVLQHLRHIYISLNMFQ